MSNVTDDEKDGNYFKYTDNSDYIDTHTATPWLLETENIIIIIIIIRCVCMRCVFYISMILHICIITFIK